VIRVNDLHYRYPGQETDTLRGVTFAAAAGTMLLVSGPTGSAKTTLALTLCGAIPKLLGGRLQGWLAVNGTSLDDVPVRTIARCVGVVMQNVECQLVNDRVTDEIAFSLENFAVPPGDMEREIDRALRRAGAEHLRDRYLGTLSAGERQRVALASVLCLGQQVLILDEPLAYLDRSAARALLGQLRQLADHGTTVVIFEHRRDMVAPLADEELRLDRGSLIDVCEPPSQLPAIDLPQSLGEDRLVFDRVTYALAGRTLLAGVELRVRAGESVVLLGDNGSGKTTLMRLALGLAKPAAGEVVTCGRRVNKTSRRRLASDAALVLQNPDHQLFLPTVAEEVRATARDPAAARSELETLALEDCQERHPHCLSTGQKRRLTLAAALARRPKLLLLDEPTVGQDDESLALMIRRLRDYVTDGGSLLVATHDHRAAKALAHRIAILENATTRPGGPELAEAYFEAGRARLCTKEHV